MDATLSFLQILSIVIACATGILAGVFDLRDDDRRLTPYGKWTVALTIIASAFGIFSTVVQSRRDEVARQDEQEKLSEQMRVQNVLLTDLRRLSMPVGKFEFSLRCYGKWTNPRNQAFIKWVMDNKLDPPLRRDLWQMPEKDVPSAPDEVSDFVRSIQNPSVEIQLLPEHPESENAEPDLSIRFEFSYSGYTQGYHVGKSNYFGLSFDNYTHSFAFGLNGSSDSVRHSELVTSALDFAGRTVAIFPSWDIETMEWDMEEVRVVSSCSLRNQQGLELQLVKLRPSEIRGRKCLIATVSSKTPWKW
jgi:hypothetical protein